MEFPVEVVMLSVQSPALQAFARFSAEKFMNHIVQRATSSAVAKIPALPDTPCIIIRANGSCTSPYRHVVSEHSVGAMR